MTAPPDDNTAHLHTVIAALRAERDAGLARETTLAGELSARTAELLERKAEFDERIGYQAATNDVLKAMSASPGDPQPIFDLIVERARDLCEGYGATVLEFDGSLLLHRASTGIDDKPAIRDALIAAYPKAPERSWPIDLAVLERRLIVVDDMVAEPNLDPALRNLTHKSVVALPLMRGEVAIGALALGGRERGGFSDSQIELLKTFAEQAVIAITSAETYRALQGRTSDLQEALEQQTATAEVLNVISRSTFDLTPVLSKVAETATRLCVADQAAIYLVQGDGVRLATNFGFPPEYEAAIANWGEFPGFPNSVTVGYRTLAERQIVHILDVTAVPGYSEVPVKLGKQRTSLGIPLLRNSEAIGLILLARQRVEPFTDRQIELVSTFADQAVIAIENTRLITEQQEALEQQTATAEVLQVINANPGVLVPVFDAMLEKAMRLCGAAFGSLYTYDGERFHYGAQRGVPEEYAEFRAKYPPIPHPEGGLARALKTRRSFQVVDVRAGEAYRAGNPNTRAMVELGGVRTILVVPLCKEEAVLGTISVYRQEVRAFTGEQIALVENFAAQAVIAIENARLITEQREALEQQTATAEVLQVINSSPGNLAPVFDAVLERGLRLCGAAFGMLGTYDGTRFRWEARLGGADRRRGVVVTPEPGSALERVANGQRVVHIPDLVDTDAYRNGIPSRVGLVERSGARAGLWVALRKDDTVLGVILIYRREPRAFSEKQIALLESFAAQAVIAMENARLINEQREALEQQTATAEVLQVINTNPGNLAPVFDTILQKAHSLCAAAMGSLVLGDGDRFRLAASHGIPERFVVLGRRPFPLPASIRRLIDGERLCHFPDVQAIDPEHDHEVAHRFYQNTDLRTGLIVPLRQDGALLGYITAYRREVRLFSEKEIALIENFAAQAVIAMENARLIDEQREALDQQTATAEVLGVINASPGDLAPVFDAMLERAMRLCRIAFGMMTTFDGERFHPVCWRGLPTALSKYFTEGGGPSGSSGMHAQLVRGAPLVYVADMKDEEAYRSGYAARRALVDLGGARTGLAIALRKEGALLGTFMLYCQEVRSFSDKEIALLQSFAAQAVIAMENARLLDEIRQRQDELRITFENMGDGVAMFDETQHLVAWNRKFQDILNVPDDIIARRQSFSEYVHYLAERGEYGPDPEEQVRQFVEQAGQSRTYERTRPDGRVIEVRHNPVPNGGFVLIYADITERKRSEAEIRAARDAAEEASRTIEAAYRDLKTAQANLIQAEKMASLGQLTAGIAHEIKNPLNFVNNFAALSVDLLSELKETAAPGFAALTEKQRAEVEEVSVMLTSNLEKITEHGKRADGIVKAMLEHSRGSSGERRMVDLNALIDEALNLAYHGARAQDQSFNVTLERDFGEGIASFEVNPQDITRVFLNLFANGFYAVTRRARSGGDAAFVPTLKVTTIDASEAVEIRVRDNGIGIPADIRDKLFQPFFTTKPTGEGTGLGLSITYDIVTQQHGGSITVDSKVGEYSEFTIRLPRKP